MRLVLFFGEDSSFYISSIYYSKINLGNLRKYDHGMKRKIT